MPGGIVLGKGENASCVVFLVGRAVCGPEDMCNMFAASALLALCRGPLGAQSLRAIRMTGWLAGELAEEFLLVHAVLEGFAPVDEDDWNFIVELAAQFVIGVDVDLVPGETAAARKFAEALFHHFTQVASFARVDDNTAEIWHASVILRGKITGFQE
jgi:hypothetical protein